MKVNEHDLQVEVCFRTLIGDIVKVSNSELKRALDAKLQNWRFIREGWKTSEEPKVET